MLDLHRLVDRVAEALGPEASAPEVEAAAGAALDALASLDASAFVNGSGTAVRSLTLGVSLLDCGSRLPQTLRARAYDKIRRTAGFFAQTLEDEAKEGRLASAERRLAVTPIALLADGQGRDDLIALAQMLDTAAADVGADRLSGFAALLERGLTDGDRTFLEALPHVLAATSRVEAAVRCAGAAGLNADAALRLAEAIALTAQQGPDACLRLAALCEGAGSGFFHPPAGPEAALYVELDAGRILRDALHLLPGDVCLRTLSEAAARAAYEAARSGAQAGRRVAGLLGGRSGGPVAFGGVFFSFDQSATRRKVLAALGVETPGAPGAAAAMLLLDGALRRGVTAASASACVPLFTTPSVRALPGDTPPDTLAALLLDAFAPALAMHRTAALRLVPVKSQVAGNVIDCGERFGQVEISTPSSPANNAFARRGGQGMLSS